MWKGFCWETKHLIILMIHLSRRNREIIPTWLWREIEKISSHLCAISSTDVYEEFILKRR